MDIQWYPRGFYIVEQGKPATKPYLILFGQAEVIREEADGTLADAGTNASLGASIR